MQRKTKVLFISMTTGSRHSHVDKNYYPVTPEAYSTLTIGWLADLFIHLMSIHGTIAYSVCQALN